MEALSQQQAVVFLEFQRHCDSFPEATEFN